jgi:hypothetical protein
MILRLIVIFLLGVAGLVGLGMSLCGGMITLTGLTEDGHHGEFPASGMLFISVPSLIIGVLIVVGVARALRRRMTRRFDATRRESDGRS